jgi:hypothetical protein
MYLSAILKLSLKGLQSESLEFGSDKSCTFNLEAFWAICLELAVTYADFLAMLSSRAPSSFSRFISVRDFARLSTRSPEIVRE